MTSIFPVLLFLIFNICKRLPKGGFFQHRDAQIAPPILNLPHSYNSHMNLPPHCSQSQIMQPCSDETRKRNTINLSDNPANLETKILPLFQELKVSMQSSTLGRVQTNFCDSVKYMQQFIRKSWKTLKI